MKIEYEIQLQDIQSWVEFCTNLSEIKATIKFRPQAIFFLKAWLGINIATIVLKIVFASISLITLIVVYIILVLLLAFFYSTLSISKNSILDTIKNKTRQSNHYHWLGPRQLTFSNTAISEKIDGVFYWYFWEDIQDIIRTRNHLFLIGEKIPQFFSIIPLRELRKTSQGEKIVDLIIQKCPKPYIFFQSPSSKKSANPSLKTNITYADVAWLWHTNLLKFWIECVHRSNANNQPDLSLLQISRATFIDASIPGNWAERARLLHSLGRYPESLICCRKVLELFTHQYNIAGQKIFKENNELHVALQIAISTRASILATLNRREEAIDRFNYSLELREKVEEGSEKQIEQSVSKVLTYFCKLSLLSSLNKANAALDLCETIISESTSTPYLQSAWMSKGNLLFILKKYDEAIDSYVKVLEIDSKLISAHYAIACCQLFIENIESCVKSLKKIISLDPDYKEFILLDPDLQKVYHSLDIQDRQVSEETSKPSTSSVTPGYQTKDPSLHQLKFRRATSNDHVAIVKLQTQVLRKVCSAHYSPTQVASLVRGQKQGRVQDNNETIFIAQDDNDRPIGFATLMSAQPFIGGVYVHPDCLRREIGSVLLKKIEQTALKKRCPDLYVLASLTAYPFFQRNGYREMQKTGFWSEGRIWVPCVMMEKSLVPLK